MTESIPRQVDKKPRVPKEEKGVWNSRGGGKDKYFFFSTFLSKDYITKCILLFCCYHNKLWKILQEMGISDHLICLLRNLYADQEATVRTGHRITVWFQIGKGVQQGCILSPYLFNLYAEYIMRNAGMDEAQAEINISEKK